MHAKVHERERERHVAPKRESHARGSEGEKVSREAEALGESNEERGAVEGLA